MTLKSGTNQACAACKYQRRKCTPGCVLAPYFPPDQPKMFLNVHKLFGVKKIQKLLEHLHPSQQNEAMSSIIYQANVRDRFPVYGCVEVIQLLQNQIRQYEEELYAVHSMLGMYHQENDHQQASSNVLPLTEINNAASQLQLGMAPPNNSASVFNPQNTPAPNLSYNSENVAVPDSQNHSYSSSSSPYNSGYLNVKETLLNSMWIQQPGSNDNNSSENVNVLPIQSQLVVTSESAEIHPDVFQDYEDMHPYLDTIDDRQSYIDSKELYNSSPESSVKDTAQFLETIAENELKSAAACFSLTSVN